MSSGKYSAVSGAIANMHALDIYANNIANANTSGYKKDRPRFASYLSEAAQEKANGINLTRISEKSTDFNQGVTRPTGSPLDLAIDGNGFFQVLKNGQTFLTRQGNFTLDRNGTLTTLDGGQVLSRDNAPIVLPSRNVMIDKSGSILSGQSQVGSIGIFDVPDAKNLQKIADGMYVPRQGFAATPMESPRVMQGFLEGSNVNIVQEMTLMMNNLRTFEAFQKTLQSYSKMGQKLDEIGSVG